MTTIEMNRHIKKRRKKLKHNKLLQILSETKMKTENIKINLFQNVNKNCILKILKYPWLAHKLQPKRTDTDTTGTNKGLLNWAQYLKAVEIKLTVDLGYSQLKAFFLAYKKNKIKE